MTKPDLDLVFLYSENSRIRLRELAALLKKSPQRIQYTLGVLEREGIVHNAHGIFDYSYFGQILFRVYFKGGYISEQDKTGILAILKDNPYLLSVYEFSGEFDLVMELAAPNPSRFNKELKKIAGIIPTLNNYKILLNVVTHMYPRAYLLNKASTTMQTNSLQNIHPLQGMQPLDKTPEQSIIIGGDREIQQFDDKELRILHHLLLEPKLRLRTLAAKTHLNIKTVQSTLQQLKKKKIIRGFRSILDYNTLGIHKFRLFLKLHNHSEEREAQLMHYLLRINEIVGANKTVGDWNLEIDIESLDKSRIRHLIAELRHEFKDLIESFNMMEFHKYYKKTYLPRYLFESIEPHGLMRPLGKITPIGKP